MKYFRQVFPPEAGWNDAIWVVRGEIARLISVSPSESTVHRPDPGKTILKTLHDRFPGSIFHESFLRPGEYFPCMARPTTSREDGPGYNPEKRRVVLHARASTTGQLHALNQRLEQICNVVHPRGRNLQTYGHEIRNVLILACTEVETLWKRMLKANRAKARNTNDYVRLLHAMKLDQYCIDFPYYPWLAPIRPFEKWDADCPSQSLTWYSAYNDVKHDRESKFTRATLIHAFQAVTGCFVMLSAQYGWDFALRGDAALRAFLRLIEVPRWTPSQLYVPASGGEYRPRHYIFTSNGSNAVK